MADGIQSEPSRSFRCRISQEECNPSVGIFVNGDCKEQDPQSDDPFCDVMSHVLSLFLSDILATIWPLNKD